MLDPHPKLRLEILPVAATVAPTAAATNIFLPGGEGLPPQGFQKFLKGNNAENFFRCKKEMLGNATFV
jgi:hypothetical protein